MMMRCLALVALGLLACDPLSGTNKERGREEMREMLGRNAERGEHERTMRDINREFTARFAGDIQPGVGCGVCPDLCKRADLRQIAAPELRRLYTQHALTLGYSEDRRRRQIAWLELWRLACVAKDGGPAMNEAWLPLLDAAEDPAVRYAAAVQAIEHRLAPEPAFRALEELAAGSSRFVDRAAIVLEEWPLGITPSL